METREYSERAKATALKFWICASTKMFCEGEDFPNYMHATTRGKILPRIFSPETKRITVT